MLITRRAADLAARERIINLVVRTKLEQSGKIPFTDLRCCHGKIGPAARTAIVQRFVSPHEKGFVTTIKQLGNHYRTIQRTTPTVVLKIATRDTQAISKEIVRHPLRHHLGISGGPMNPVSARTQTNIDQAAGALPSARIKGTCLHPHFADGVHWGNIPRRHPAIRALRCIRNAIQSNVGGAASAAAHAVVNNMCWLIRTVQFRVTFKSRARRKCNQRIRISVRNWQFG